MNNDVKIIIAFIVTILALGLIYFGAFLPLRKSQIYIDTYRNLSGVKSFEEFNKSFDKVFDFYSSVGQEEIISGYLNVIANLISNQKFDKQTVDILINKSEKIMEPFLMSGKGFNLSQNIYSLGAIYEMVADKFNNDKIYRQKSIFLYKEGLKYSPNRPIFLLGLFRNYYNSGDKEKAKEIGEIIIKYWPEDERVKKILKQL